MSEAPGGAVTVVGLGAMGGSVALAVRDRWPGVPVYGVDPDLDAARQARRVGVRTAAGLDECEVEGGVVVFAAPLDVTVRMVRETVGEWSRAALVTDVASLKGPVMTAAREAMRDRADSAGASAAPVGASPTFMDASPSYVATPPTVVATPPTFVGAHPMCGSERSGFGAARADMFVGADIWLCPAGGAEGSADGADGSERADRGVEAGGAVELAAAFWAALGGRPRTIDADAHDRLMSWASHLPQLLANTLAAALDEAGIAPDALGPGGRDMTRLAGSNPTMWLPLLDAARKSNVGALARIERQVSQMRIALERRDAGTVEALMEKGRRWASQTA